MMPLPITDAHIRPMPPTDARRDAVLAALDAAGGLATCFTLAEATGLNASTVRNALRRLEWTKDVERVGGLRSTTQHRAVFRRVGA
jgi:DNA-binding transcriptional regulator YhcF (GntR family)